MKGSDIRTAFLEYFADNGHTIVSSSSLVPHDDPTLLFTNAGMNQFKDIFLGKETRTYNRATTCQKVVRAGGKHNDLENVGRTARHHTFFEMLGNFSFGDYFKVEAIKFGWELLTVKLKIPADKLFVTVYEKDDEAYDIWHKVIGLPESKIYRMGEKDNFWQMGDTGPCGPCSEIHFDQGPDVGCKRPECDPYCDCDRHLEIWNLVFMQYNRSEDGTLTPLPKPSIDTGAGLERVAAVMQGVDSNYDTDLIKPIIEYIAQLAGKRYGDNESDDVSMRVIADHSRSTTFLVADGVMPSNEGRGYVLRRIMRRAMRHGKMLGLNSEFFYKVSGFIVDFMKGHYFELADKKEYIVKIVKTEESAFGKTLSSGMKLISEEILPKHNKTKVIDGEDIFKLYDTHGFPVDLLTDIAEDAGYTLDMQGFEQHMKEQQERAKRSSSMSNDSEVSDVLIKIGAEIETEFIGYESSSCNADIYAIIKDGKEVDELQSGDKADIILKTSPFYAESGGQIGDSGVIDVSGALFHVSNTLKVGGAFIHRGELNNGNIKKSASAVATIDCNKRKLVEQNHTATHLLHKALQRIIGGHARQAGSMVSDDKLRFDYTHTSALSNEEIACIEREVNNIIFANLPITKELMSIQDAMNAGATALFGEKYHDTVRVVSVNDFSMELCGGCHTNNTSMIGLFKIIEETSVASGIRRIEAVTGVHAYNVLNKHDAIVKQLASQFKSPVAEVVTRVTALQDTLKERERQLKTIEEKSTAKQAEQFLSNVKVINDVNVLSVRLDNSSVDSMRNFIDMAKNKLQSCIVLVGGVTDGKVMFVCGVTKDLIGKYKAGAIVKEVAKIAGGSGGGKDDMAQAGAKDAAQVDAALESIYKLV